MTCRHAAGFRDDAQFQLDFGRALFRAGRHGDALRRLRRVLEIAPGSTAAGAAGDLIEIIEGTTGSLGS